MRISEHLTYRNAFMGAVLALMIIIPILVYADSIVDSTPTNDRQVDVVMTSDSNAFMFYVDSTGQCVMASSTDAGDTWGAPRNMLASCLHVSAWYDSDTPGVNDVNIHIAALNGTDLYYAQLNTSTGALSSAVDISTPSSQGGAFAANQNFTTIAKATDGYLYAAVADNSDAFVVRCNTTCTTGSNWTEAGTNPMDLTTGDSHQLLPLADGDMMLIRNDISADDYQSKIWDVSAGSWAGSWTNIDISATDTTTYNPMWGATIDPDSNDLYLAYVGDGANVGNSTTDLRIAKYSGGSWTTSTIWTNTPVGIYGASPSYDPVNDRVLVAYILNPSASDNDERVQVVSGTNALTGWGATTTVSRHQDNESRYVTMNKVARYAAAVAWNDFDDTDIFFSLAEDPFNFGSQALTRLTGNVRIVSNLTVTGALAKSSGTFVIDHPLEPREKLLYHSFVESPDVKNLYDGVVQLDSRGEARIELPDYFQALNTDFRYQFFPHGEPMPDLYVKEEITQNAFVIAGGVPGGEISWQVTGNRHDPYILANPVVTEVEKTATTEIRRGECVHEPLCE